VILKANKLSIDHPDEDVGELLIMEAMGTWDHDLFRAVVKQLAHAATSDGKFDENELNSMLSVVTDINARDHVEVMLGAQMAAVHLAIMRIAKMLANATNDRELEMALRMLTKLTRTFPVQMDALKRYRSRGEQGVTVQNVSVEDGGQAIVGNVTQNAAAAGDATAASPPIVTEARTAPALILEPEQQVDSDPPKSEE
jgi:hypothetical protein